jgi:hypothetical protein
MVDKSAFTSEEWGSVLAGVLYSAMAITAAEPSGLIGLVQEGVAGGRILLDESKTASGGLIKSIAEAIGSGEGRAAAKAAVNARMEGVTRDEVKTRAINGLRQAMMVVGRKAPDDAAAYGALLVKTAEATAEAATEGGFLGFGGVRVTDAEKATLGEIRQAVGVA